MTILALEFSSPQRSVAIVRGVSHSPGQQETSTFGKVHRANEPGRASLPASHGVAGGLSPGSAGASPYRTEVHWEGSEIIMTGRTGNALGMIEAALLEAKVEREQIECVAVGIGPGSYTGIRSAIAVAQGWELASGATKLLAVSSAECIAAQAQVDGLTGRVAVVIDAQRDEFYLAVYEMDAEKFHEVKPLRLATKAEVEAERLAGSQLIGPEVTNWFAEGRLIFPRAAILGQLAGERSNFVRGEEIEPIYLRETKFVKAAPHRAPGH